MTFGCKWEKETQAASPARNDDPYGTWLLGHGSAFAIRSRISKEDDADFSHEFVSSTFEREQPAGTGGNNRNGDSREQRQGLSLKEKWEKRGKRKPKHLTETALLPSGDRTSEAEGPKELVRIPAPLRQLSIGTGKIGSLDWNMPAHLNGLPQEQKEKIVVTAVMDDGMNIAHDSFRGPDNTSRVEFAWIQDGSADNRLRFGREWRRAEIEAAITESNGDEERLLKALDLVTFERQNTSTVARHVSHGTHMMDLAAGYRWSEFEEAYENDWSLRPEPLLRPIISVHLPFLMTQESSGATYGPFVQQGLRYIFQRVRDMSKALGVVLPVVINFSYAVSAGPHNGRHFVERLIRTERANHLNLLAKSNLKKPIPPRRVVTVVLPAGNRHQARGHALAEATRAGSTTLSMNWRLQPGDQTSSYLEIWLPKDASNVQVTVKAPGAEESEFVALARRASEWQAQLLRAPGSGDVIARLSSDRGTTGRGVWPYGRRRFLLAVAPTDIDWVARAPAPSGTWVVTVTAEISSNERIEAWVQRDESPYRFRANARQSYLEDANYQRFAKDGKEKQDDTLEETELHGGKPSAPSPVRRAGTLSGMATGRHVTVVGALYGRTREPSSYSASGNVAAETDAVRDDPNVDEEQEVARPAKIRGPRFMEAADWSRVRPGVLAAGSRSGSSVAITGTSAAAPQVARQLADRLYEAASSPSPPQETTADELAAKPTEKEPVAVKRPRQGKLQKQEKRKRRRDRKNDMADAD